MSTTPAPTGSKCVYRLNVNSVSNPDPITGGLLVNSAATHPGIFNVPLTALNQGLGIANPTVSDVDNLFTFTEPLNNDRITCNVTGDYVISSSIGCLSNVLTPNNLMTFQVLQNGQAVFTSPPAVDGGQNFFTTAATPVGPFYNIGAFSSGSAVVHLTAGDVLSLVFYLQADTCVIVLTSNLSISVVSPNIGPPGPTGPAGPPGPPGTPAESGFVYCLVEGATVAIGADILFDSNGPLTSGITHVLGTSQITVAVAGKYQVLFSVSGVEPNQFAIFVNGALVPGCIYGSGAGTQQNTGLSIINLLAGDIITIRNFSSAAAVTLASLVGGTQANSVASVLITQIVGGSVGPAGPPGPGPVYPIPSTDVTAANGVAYFDGFSLLQSVSNGYAITPGNFSGVFASQTSITGSNNSAILGGRSHTIGATSNRAVIVGGSGNSITAGNNSDLILGGESNLISGTSNNSIVMGGSNQVMDSASGSIMASDDRAPVNTNTQSSVLKMRFANGVQIGEANVSLDTDATSLLQLDSTIKVFYPPRMTTVQKLAIPALGGAVVFDLTLGQLSYFNGAAWVNL